MDGTAKGWLGALLLAGALAGPMLPGGAAAAEEHDGFTVPGFACPSIPYWPVTKRARFPELITTLFPPLKVIQEIGRDPLEKAPKRPVSVRVLDAAGKPVRGALVGFLRRDQDGLRFLAEAAPGKPVAVPLGDYVINAAVRDADGGVRWGSTRLSLAAKGPAAAKVTLHGHIPPVRPKPVAAEAIQGAELALDVEGLWQHNATIERIWMGPKRTHTNIGEMDDDEDEPSMPPTITQRPFMLTAPGRAGPYELRYTLCAPRIVLARWPLRVTRAQVSIAAPERAPVASRIDVTVRGQLAKAQTLHLRDPDGKTVERKTLSPAAEVQAALQLPFAPGSYELAVMVDGDPAPLAHRRLAVEPALIAITFPERITMGDKAALDWPLSDSIDTTMGLWSVAAPGRPAHPLWERLRAGDIRLVAAPGAYELRLQYRRKLEEPQVIARKALTVEGRAFLDPPRSLAAGQPVALKLALTGQFFDRVMVVPRGKDRALSLFDEVQPRGTSVTVKVPAKPGAYDLVYQMGEVGHRMIVERVPVDVQ
ncbi:MAG: hypothetical protein IT538_15990 [Variibacter sp.]|nr:hypothetical protein [Variibacter sp.]